MSKPRIPLSVIIPCYNEELMIGDCLASVGFAEEILVVDSFSTDRTLEIAKEHGARVLQQKFVCHGAQNNWAIPQANHPWVMVVDADERVTPELRVEIEEILKEPAHEGYWIRRRNHFLGKHIRHGAWRKDRVLRLFRRDAGRYEDKHAHAEVKVSGTVGWCQERLVHYSYRSLDDLLRKAPYFTRGGALNARDKGIRSTGWRIFGHATGHFLKSYFLQQGFRDGAEGLIIAYMESYMSFLKYAKLYELQRDP